MGDIFSFYVFRDPPNFESLVARFITEAWNFVENPTIHLHEDKYFIIPFQSKQDCDHVLMGCPYTMVKKVIFNRHWSPPSVIHDALSCIPL